MMFNRLLDHWRRAPLDAPAPQPDRPMAVVGDVHGRLDLLEPLIDHLVRDPDLHREGDLVLLGDLIDRGPDSAGVIDLVRDLQSTQPDRVVALSGNHEAMALDFLDGGKHAGMWLRHGGLATLASFALPVSRELDMAALRVAATEAIGAARIDWLRGLPLLHRSGTVVAVHAAFDRNRTMSAQNSRRLLWGAREFYHTHSTALPWVVHGHVITSPPLVEGTRIAVDSGAWQGGGLSAAVLVPGQAPRLVTVHG